MSVPSWDCPKETSRCLAEESQLPGSQFTWPNPNREKRGGGGRETRRGGRETVRERERECVCLCMRERERERWLVDTRNCPGSQ